MCNIAATVSKLTILTDLNMILVILEYLYHCQSVVKINILMNKTIAC